MNNIHVNKFTISIGGKHLFKEAQINLIHGKKYALVGVNGCGKTTLLKAIIGLIKYQQGSIEVSGNRIEELERRELARRMAFVPQMMEPVAGFNVEELVLLGRTPYFGRFVFESKKDQEVVDWAIGELRIEKLRDRPLTKLSGGEFQRVAIARAIAQEPRILLLDEPTTHLDIRFQVKICRLMSWLRKHRSIISTFHDLNLASRYCSKLILIKKGEMIAEGKPADVVTPENIWKAYHIKAVVKSNPRNKKAKYVLLP